MEITLPELAKILEEIQGLKEQLNNSQQQLPEWLNDEQCHSLKGGMALTTYRANRYYQVKGGIPDAYVGGRKVWNKKSVLEWLPLTDADLPEYHLKYKTGARKK